MADESTIRIRADASQAVSELTKLRNAITLSYNFYIVFNNTIAL